MKYLWIVLCTIIWSSGIAQAELTKGSQTIAVLGGLSGSGTEYDYKPGSREPVTGGGGAYGAQYLYYLSQIPAIGLGADIVVSPNGNEDDNDLLFNYNTTQRVKSVVGLFMARLSYPRGMFRPYLFGGLGAHSSSQKLYAAPRSGTWPGGGTETRLLIDEDKTSVALGGGIGFDLFPTESFFVGAEIRGTWLAGLDTDDNAALKNAGFNVDQKKGINQGNILFRAGFKF